MWYKYGHPFAGPTYAAIHKNTRSTNCPYIVFSCFTYKQSPVHENMKLVEPLQSVTVSPLKIETFTTLKMVFFKIFP